MLAYLCLAQGTRLLRSRVAGIIWDRSGEAEARASLRHALAGLNRMTGWALERDQETIRLNMSAYWIDALEGPDRSDVLLEGFEGLSTSFDHWLLGERNRFTNR